VQAAQAARTSVAGEPHADVVASGADLTPAARANEVTLAVLTRAKERTAALLAFQCIGLDGIEGRGGAARVPGDATG
jgi:hypothetical protein